jgi:hypothetical protein
MSRFATAAHLISWAGLCPKNDESTGKRRSTRMRKGAPWLKTALIQCSRAAPRAKRAAISRPNSTAPAPVAAPKRPSAPSLLRSSPPSTTYSRTASATRRARRIPPFTHLAALTPARERRGAIAAVADFFWRLPHCGDSVDGGECRVVGRTVEVLGGAALGRCGAPDSPAARTALMDQQKMSPVHSSRCPHARA